VSLYTLRGRLSSLPLSLPLSPSVSLCLSLSFSAAGLPGREAEAFFLDRFGRGDYGRPRDFDITNRALARWRASPSRANRYVIRAWTRYYRFA